MLHVILLILKIIGIIILVLLGLLLLVILAVLFVPVRYRVELEKKDTFFVKIKVSWLLSFFAAHFRWIESVTEAYARILFFRIWDLNGRPEKKSKKQSKKPPQRQSAEQPIEKPIEQRIEQPIENFLEEAHKEQESQTSYEAVEEKPPKKSIFKRIADFFGKVRDAIRNIGYTIKKLYDKIKHMIENISYYVELIQSETAKNSFSYVKSELIYLWKKISPRKLRGNVLFGTGDAYSTGQILSAVSMFYPVYGNHINIRADFEEKVFYGDLFFRGRMQAYMFLVIFFRYRKNKDLAEFIQLLKREA